jgi:hypothetical protein
MLMHTDLSGLVLQSEVVVVAERLTPADAGHAAPALYRVVKVLTGAPLDPGTELQVDDGDYVTEGHALDPLAVLFLTRRQGRLVLVQSGLRVVEGGRVLRFEQRRNPGLFEAVPQGEDPRDQWQPGPPTLDLAGLEASIARAVTRVSAFKAATAEVDPLARRARLLALFPEPTGSRPGPSFYSDELAQQAYEGLASAGDVEGALRLVARDRGRRLFSSQLPLPELLALAKDTTRDAPLRVAALESLGDLFLHLAVAREVLGLVDDAVPSARAAAVGATAALAQVVSSDRGLKKGLQAFTTASRAAIAARYAREEDSGVLFAIATAFTRSFRRPLPQRAGGPPVASDVFIAANELRVDVACLRSMHVKSLRLSAQVEGRVTVVPWSGLTFSCGVEQVGSWAGDAAPLPAGTWPLTVELMGAAELSFPVGALAVAPDGALRISPRAE